MSELATFLDMGGYAVYVWWSYGLAAVVLIGNVLLPVWDARRARARIARRGKLDRNRSEGRET